MKSPQDWVKNQKPTEPHAGKIKSPQVCLVICGVPPGDKFGLVIIAIALYNESLEKQKGAWQTW